MVKRSKGLRSKSRKILRKKVSDYGKSPITRALQKFAIGEKVNIDVDPAVHKGMPHIRFQGLTGDVEGKQGDAYLIGINAGKKRKTIIVKPEHLRGAK